MSFSVADMKARLAALQEARWAGVRATTIEGRSVTYSSDAEMAAAIADLERRIAQAGRPRPRVTRPFAVKDL